MKNWYCGASENCNSANKGFKYCRANCPFSHSEWNYDNPENDYKCYYVDDEEVEEVPF